MSAGRPWAPQLLNWARIARLGEDVPVDGSAERTAETTSVIYLVALGDGGAWGGAYQPVEVTETRPARVEPHEWSPRPEFLPRMRQGPDGVWRAIGTIRGSSWGSGSAGASVSAAPEIIFTDEQSTVTWSVTNATGATMSESAHTSTLLPGGISGTMHDGGSWGAGATPGCGAPMSGSWPVSGQTSGHCRRYYAVHACTAPGQPSAADTAWLDVLGVPTFTGAATSARVKEIRDAVKAIDLALRQGAVINDPALDATVDAFTTGRIDRRQFWYRLLDELENLHLDTFACQDVTDKKWGGGHWSDYGNQILLDWSPSYTPALDYVIAHELIHKCGFNGCLLTWYSHSQIETMCHEVSSSVIP
ncbi:MAG: hypothetical protein WAL50_10900 [Kineosporiaceae bacterium]